MAPLEGDNGEAKELEELKLSTPNKLFRRPPVLFSWIPSGNDSYKLKTEIREIFYSIYQQSKKKTVYKAQ